MLPLQTENQFVPLFGLFVDRKRRVRARAIYDLRPTACSFLKGASCLSFSIYISIYLQVLRVNRVPNACEKFRQILIADLIRFCICWTVVCACDAQTDRLSIVQNNRSSVNTTTVIAAA